MASSTPAPNLLNIPREIRNQIYSYLHQNLQLRATERMGVSQVFIKLTSVPYPSVYRVHPRLNTEYQESGPINNVSALIFNRNHGEDKKYWHTDVKSILREDIALTHVKSVTLRFSINPDVEGADPIDLLSALALKAEGLRTIRIAEYAVIRVFHDEPLPKHVRWLTDDKIPPLPNVFASLPLVQRANCRWSATRLVSGPRFRPVAPGIGLVWRLARTVEEHVVHQCRTHLYSTRRLGKGLLTPFDVMYSDQPLGYIKWREQLFKKYKIKIKPKSERVIAWNVEDCTKKSDDGSLRSA